MTIAANSFQILHHWAGGVMERAGHHAPQVREIVQSLIGGIVWHGEPGSVEVRQYAGKTSNCVWWRSTVSGNWYAALYNHNSGKIEIRDGNLRGQVLHTIDNSTLASGMTQIFEVL